MAGALKELRDRITTVQATQKITSAMRMVAAAKLRQARLRVDQGRWHQKFLNQLLGRFVMNLESCEHPPELLVGRSYNSTNDPQAVHLFYHDDNLRHSPHQSGLLILISGDRGLCGSYNTRLIAAARQWIATYQDTGGDFSVICVGRKMTEVLTRDYANYIVNNYTQAELLARGPGYEMEPVAENILNLYTDSKYEVADIIYTKFINVMQSDVVRVPLVPLTRCVQPEFLKEKSIYTFEPGLDEILPSFVPDYLNLCLRDAFIESIASEQAARMTAMENATRNAEEMVGKLRLEYNQTRQSTITRELIEIISGAEVL